MDVSQAIQDRRSIRKFQDRPVSSDVVEALLEAACKAPSGKNRQPWRFVVLQGEPKLRLVNLMEQRVTAVKETGYPVGSAEGSVRVMRQAPVLILVFNANWTPEDSLESHAWDLVDTQSIGAAIQNMLLAATAAGLGTLWLCDVVYARQAITEFVGLKGGLVAAVSLGYPAEAPEARPRKSVQEVTRWIE